MVVPLIAEDTLWGADGATLYGMGHRKKPSQEVDSLKEDDSLIDGDRRKKIAALKQAVADGTYKVSADQLADKLIDQMLEPKG
ncbi:MAG: flagellar biosynthesis anti-sigma factor FlgM [Acidobacteriaceae bacterium]